MVALPEEKKQERSPRFAAGDPDWPATMASHTRLLAVHVYQLQYKNLEKIPVGRQIISVSINIIDNVQQT